MEGVKTATIPVMSSEVSISLSLTWIEAIEVIRLHSEIDQIHPNIEAQCDTTRLPLGDCHKPA